MPDDTHQTPDPETRSHLERQAEYIANGILPFPGDLSLASQEALTLLVVRCRRQRLISWVARTLALDLHRKKAKREADDPLYL